MLRVNRETRTGIDQRQGRARFRAKPDCKAVKHLGDALLGRHDKIIAAGRVFKDFVAQRTQNGV